MLEWLIIGFLVSFIAGLVIGVALNRPNIYRY